MLRYLLHRILYSLLLLWGVATLVFLLFYMPQVHGAGQPATARAGTPGVGEGSWPLLRSYGRYLSDLSPVGLTAYESPRPQRQVLPVLRVADSSVLSLKAPALGRSATQGANISYLLGCALPGSAALVLSALLLAAITGVALGILSARKRGTAWDTGSVAAALIGMAVPPFVAAVFIAWAAGSLRGDPPGGSSPLGLMLPAIVLSIRPMAVILQATRSSMLDVMRQDYICAAAARGLGSTRILLRHALPNVLNPVLRATGGWLAELLGGAFFVEYVFGRAGVGSMAVSAFQASDRHLAGGAILLAAVVFIAIKLIAALISGLVDPRLRA